MRGWRLRGKGWRGVQAFTLLEASPCRCGYLEYVRQEPFAHCVAVGPIIIVRLPRIARGRGPGSRGHSRLCTTQLAASCHLQVLLPRELKGRVFRDSGGVEALQFATVQVSRDGCVMSCLIDTAGLLSNSMQRARHSDPRALIHCFERPPPSPARKGSGRVIGSARTYPFFLMTPSLPRSQGFGASHWICEHVPILLNDPLPSLLARFRGDTHTYPFFVMTLSLPARKVSGRVARLRAHLSIVLYDPLPPRSQGFGASRSDPRALARFFTNPLPPGLARVRGE